MIRIFIGTDRSQYLATKVLIHSIKAHSNEKIAIETLDNIKIPEPKDVRQSQRTGFSFARWAIPEVCGYKGKAIYLDADMLVFTDIVRLWNTEMGDAIISLVDGRNAKYCSSGVKLNKNESSVMLLNCNKANWNLEDLVKGLDGQYSYKEMMSDLCFITDEKINRDIARSWNSMDYWDETVDLIHYTNVPTQPWVSLENPYGYIWVNYLKKMLCENSISIYEIENEINLGYVRPSLLLELNEEIVTTQSESTYIEKLKNLDLKNGYLPHREVYAWNERRNEAIRKYELQLMQNQGVCKLMLYGLKKFVKFSLNAGKNLYKKYNFVK